MDKKIRNVVFDLGGVLVNLDVDNCVNAFRKAGFEEIDTTLFNPDPSNFFNAFELGNVTAQHFRDCIRQHIHQPLSDQKIDDMWNLMLLNIPIEKLNLLLRLRRRYMVYLLSNTNEIHWDYACRHFFKHKGFRMSDYFEQVFLSFQLHCQKPDKRIYQLMMDEANILPEETLFIDDKAENCQTAATLGIHTHHYTDQDDLQQIILQNESH